MPILKPGSSLHGILQARILEWIAIPFSRGSSGPRTEPRPPTLQTDSLLSEPQGNPYRKKILILKLLYSTTEEMECPQPVQSKQIQVLGKAEIRHLLAEQHTRAL